MKKRTFDEMIEYFISEVRKMQIEDRYKMQLVGMITVIQSEHEEELNA